MRITEPSAGRLRLGTLGAAAALLVVGVSPGAASAAPGHGTPQGQHSTNPAGGAGKEGRDVPRTPPGWQLTWKDDFNGAAGHGVSPGKWIYDTGTGYGCAGCPDQWGTGEVETMTSSPRNVSLDGRGDLLITPVRTASGGWTSGRIETRDTGFTAGDNGILRVQASIELPQTGSGTAATGYWPAFWMLGAPFRGDYLNWPSVGEIDIMENINGRGTDFATLHCGTNPGGPCNETSGIGRTIDSSTLQSQFHTYAMELDRSVTPNQLRFYLDDTLVGTVTETEVGAQAWQQATDHGFFIILDVAMGGGFPAAECQYFPHPGGCTASTPVPGPETVSGKPMKVAYVAVYNKKVHGRPS